jgi:hypothetical protein
MEMTINQLAKEFEIIAQEHKQINGFFFGEFFQAFAQEEPVSYPLLVVSLLPGSMAEKSVNVNCVITICDKYITDSPRSLREVHSDCLQTLRDIDITLRQERFEDLTLSTQNATEPFVERQADIVAGWSMTAQMNVFDLQDWCAIPYYNYDFENGQGSYVPQCEPATVENSTQTYAEQIQSGGTLVLPDTEIIFEVEGQEPVSQQIPTLSNETIYLIWQ